MALHCRPPGLCCRAALPPAASAQFVANRLARAPLHTLPGVLRRPGGRAGLAADSGGGEWAAATVQRRPMFLLCPPSATCAGGRAVVPLLHPQHHGLPFALTVELHAAPRGAAAAAGAAPQPPAAPDRSLFALHYVLAGSGQLVRQGSSGAEPLQAGDAVLMHAGAAAVGTAATDAAADSAGASSGLGPYQIAELVAYLPQELFEQQQAQQGKQQGQQAGQQQGAFTLPLLQQGSSSSSGSSSSRSSSSKAEHQLSEELAAALLAGARDIARQAASAADSRQSAAAQQQPPAAASRGSSEAAGAVGVLRLLRSAAASLADWWAVQQGRACPVTKRTLGELTAFQLPNQTNRLAVQFDPFSRPQVRAEGRAGAAAARCAQV